MTRLSKIVWPVVALVASFVAVFALTSVFADPRTPAEQPSTPAQTEQASPSPAPETPLENGLVIEVRGVKGLPAGSSTSDWPVVNVLEVSAEQICLAKEFTDNGWSPEGNEPWDTTSGRWCRRIEAGQSVNLKFVKHE